MDKVVTIQEVSETIMESIRQNAGVPVPQAVKQKVRRVCAHLDLRKVVPPLRKGAYHFDRRAFKKRPAAEREFYRVYDRSTEPPEVVLEKADPTRARVWRLAAEAAEQNGGLLGVFWEAKLSRHRAQAGRWPDGVGVVFHGRKAEDPEKDPFYVKLAAAREAIVLYRRSVKGAKDLPILNFPETGGVPPRKMCAERGVTQAEVVKYAKEKVEWDKKKLKVREELWKKKSQKTSQRKKSQRKKSQRKKSQRKKSKKTSGKRKKSRKTSRQD